MAKFRNWNEKLNDFIYFEDGKYFNGEDWQSRNPKGKFNWQNAEQEFTREEVKFFEGDKFLLEESYYGVIALEEGILIFNVYDRETNEFIDSENISDSYIGNMERLGNIHEE